MSSICTIGSSRSSSTLSMSAALYTHTRSKTPASSIKSYMSGHICGCNQVRRVTSSSNSRVSTLAPVLVETAATPEAAVFSALTRSCKASNTAPNTVKPSTQDYALRRHWCDLGHSLGLRDCTCIHAAGAKVLQTGLRQFLYRIRTSGVPFCLLGWLRGRVGCSVDAVWRFTSARSKAGLRVVMAAVLVQKGCCM